MGNITSKDAFAASMAEAHRRADIVSTLGLSLQERVQILKIWMPPVLLLTARAYYPDPIVISSLTTVFQTALGFDSWGLTIHQMAKLKTEGGHELPPLPGLAHDPSWVGLHYICEYSHSFHDTIAP